MAGWFDTRLLNTPHFSSLKSANGGIGEGIGALGAGIAGAGKVGSDAVAAEQENARKQAEQARAEKMLELAQTNQAFNQDLANRQFEQATRMNDHTIKNAEGHLALGWARHRANQANAQRNYELNLLKARGEGQAMSKAMQEVQNAANEAAYIDDVIKNAKSYTLSNDSTLRQGQQAQFLDKADKNGENYDSTHGFVRGVGEWLGGWMGNDLNAASDQNLQGMLNSMTREGKNAKWSYENTLRQFPINQSTLEGNNRHAAQAIAGEWIARMPAVLESDLMDEMSKAKTATQKQSAVNKYKEQMGYYNEYSKKLKNFYFNGKDFNSAKRSDITPISSADIANARQTYATITNTQGIEAAQKFYNSLPKNIQDKL